MIEKQRMPFSTNVLKSLKILFIFPDVKEVSNVFLTPLWYNESLILPLKPECFKKGISIIADLINDNCSFLFLGGFQEIYNVKTNLLKYGGLILTLKYYLDN